MGGSSGGSTTQVIQPSAPPQPTGAEAIQAWVESMPQVYETQMEYAPKEAAQQVAIAQEFAQPMGEAYLAAQKAMYPETTAIQEKLAGQAVAGMDEPIPENVQEQYISDIRGNLGTNAGSPIGAEYTSRQMQQLGMDWQNYYRNLGLSVAGRQPLTQPQSPSYSNYMSGYTPGQSMDFMASTYGPFAAASRPIVSQNQGGVPNWIPAMQTGGQMAGSGMMAAGMAMSSIKLKEKVEDVDSGLDTIDKVHAVLFDWKENGTKDGGVIAEELEEILPDAVLEINGIKHIKPMMLIAYLIKAVQELKEKVNG